MALLPLTRELHDEWSVRVAFHARAATTPAMQKLLSRHYQRDLRAGIKDLEKARSRGEIRRGIEPADAYRTIMSSVGGVGLAALMNPAQLAPKDQVAILKSCIDALRA